MVENKIEILEKLQDRIDELSKEGEETDAHHNINSSDVVLFFSFDIVNSTAYKTINYYGWAQVINLLFKELRVEVDNRLNGSEMWRVLGDEAIFIIKVRSENELCEYINRIFKIMVSTIYKLKKGEFFKLNHDKFNAMKQQNILSLKTSAWIAAVTDVGNINDKDILQENADNIFERYHSNEGYEIFEFLGNDIDTGFRISKQTQDGRMVLSYELAYLISRQTESLSCLHIITYRKLKGVWKDKLYPIIWYHDPKAYSDEYKKEIELTDSFAFDACDESDLIKEYYDNREADKKECIIRDKEMYTSPLHAINKILQDRMLEEKIKQIQRLIKNATHDQTKYINTEWMQIHCVAVCFKEFKDGTKILVAKRSDDRKKNGGAWEFGCAKAVIDKSIAQKLKEEYKNDFDIDIEPILDGTREIKEPIPIALYQVIHDPQLNDPDKKDKGIITLARIITDFNPAAFAPTAKHDKVQWIMESDLSNIERKFENRVPDFEQTLKVAFEKIKLISMEKT